MKTRVSQTDLARPQNVAERGPRVRKQSGVQGAMARTTHCTQCKTTLNIPEEAAGKRLKCPKCGTKFYAEPAPSGTLSVHDAVPADPSSEEIKQRGHGDIDLPTSAGNLRETFDIPLLGELESESRPSRPARGGGDALALFEDDKPVARRPNAAEARAKARRCPTCSGFVPAGMSICQTCGLDLETGMRVGLDDDLAPPPSAPSMGLPLHVMLVGGVCFLGSTAAAAYSVYQSLSGVQYGWRYFIPFCLFAIWASLQFLKGKSPKTLLAALTFAVVLNVIALIIMPVFEANSETKVIERPVSASDDPNSAGEIIQPITERLDMDRITTGIVLIVIYTFVSLYLLSSAANRHHGRT